MNHDFIALSSYYRTAYFVPTARPRRTHPDLPLLLRPQAVDWVTSHLVNCEQPIRPARQRSVMAVNGYCIMLKRRPCWAYTIYRPGHWGARPAPGQSGDVSWGRVSVIL